MKEKIIFDSEETLQEFINTHPEEKLQWEREEIFFYVIRLVSDIDQLSSTLRNIYASNQDKQLPSIDLDQVWSDVRTLKKQIIDLFILIDPETLMSSPAYNREVMNIRRVKPDHVDLIARMNKKLQQRNRTNLPGFDSSQSD
ncbi:MAG TPA: hypothetical protein VF209_04030 [Patescibacteria group bacterium]